MSSSTPLSGETVSTPARWSSRWRLGVVGMEWHTERRHSPGLRVGDARNATVLRTVGTDIALLCRQVESMRTDEGVPAEVRDRLEVIAHEPARLARLTDTAAAELPIPRLPDDAAAAHRLARQPTHPAWPCPGLPAPGP